MWKKSRSESWNGFTVGSARTTVSYVHYWRSYPLWAVSCELWKYWINLPSRLTAYMFIQWYENAAREKQELDTAIVNNIFYLIEKRNRKDGVEWIHTPYSIYHPHDTLQVSCYSQCIYFAWRNRFAKMSNNIFGIPSYWIVGFKRCKDFIFLNYHSGRVWHRLADESDVRKLY